MSATNRAVNLKKKTAAEAIAEARSAAPVPLPAAPIGEPPRVPQLRVMPLLSSTQHRRFLRVPTHAVGVSHEHREYPRASLKLPLRLRSVNQVAENFPITLVTRDISSTGVFFLCPKELAAGTAIEIEIVLVNRPMGRGNVVIATPAHVRRIERAAMPGWYGVAASFDDVNFDRDDSIPLRFLDY
jgi:PilZ domain-containing protein